jgi:hypothetical protein
METHEADGGGDYVLRRDLSLAWVHVWATRFSTAVDIGFGDDEYGGVHRTDDYFYWGVGATYTFSSHFRFGASVNSYDRDSSVRRYDYDNMVYMLSLEVTY